MKSGPWSKSEIAVLHDMIAGGATHTEIAQTLDRSKNSVSGMKRRLGLSNASKNPIVHRPPSIIDRHIWSHGQCAWVIGDPIDLVFCSEVAQEGSSYCAEHHALAYKKTKNVIPSRPFVFSRNAD